MSPCEGKRGGEHIWAISRAWLRFFINVAGEECNLYWFDVFSLCMFSTLSLKSAVLHRAPAHADELAWSDSFARDKVVFSAQC